MKWLRYSLNELFNNKAFCYLFIVNLSFGLTGFIALDGFKVSLNHTIKLRSKAVLGGDFGISSRHPFSKEEVESVETKMESPFFASKMVEMVSMVANQNRRSRLVQIKAVEETYPYYGELQLEEKGSVVQSSHESLKNNFKVWIYPELKRQLGVQTGDKIFIGEQEFEIDDVVKADAAAGLSTNMAPRIYMSLKNLEATRLLRKGSIAWYSRIYRLPGLDSDQLAKLRDKIFDSLENPQIRVYTHENVSAQMTTMLNRLNDFLGLTSLVALFLAAVGSAFLFRSYFNQRINQVAILMSLGASRWQASFYFLLQVMLLGLMSAILAIVMSFGIVPGIGYLTKELLPFDIQFFLDPQSLLFGLVIGVLGSLLICLPILISLRKIEVGVLLNQGSHQTFGLSLVAILATLPGLMMFAGLAIWLANSYQVGGLFTGLFLISALLLGLASMGLFRGLATVRFPKLSLQWALRDLARQKSISLVGFVAIGLGALLLNLVPQVRSSIAAELERPEQSKLPSLFMFDIQEEQLPLFKSILNDQGVPVDQVSPTIRARLVSINDKEFDKGKGHAGSFSREEEREMRFRNRGFNLSYRAQLSDSERLIQGKDFSGVYEEGKGSLAEISVEKRFAKRLGFKMGDKLKFEIESVPIEGQIINIREVKWTSFQPNFFVQFQPGVLEMAPKTFIATVPGLVEEKKFQVQDQLVENLPNISMVDVSRIVKRINEIMEQMSWALAFMSFLCLFSGFIVLFSIANHQARQRRWEIGLLKTLGSSFGMIQNQFLWQFCLISFLLLV